MRRLKLLFLSLALLTIQGCSGVVTMEGYGADRISEIGIYAVDSSKRVIMADMDNGLFCAEPPPETHLESESSFRMLLEAAIDTTSDTGKIEAYRALSEKAKQLYRRSHSVQLYRDASYYLCQSYVNGALTVSPKVRQELLNEYASVEEKNRESLEQMTSQLEELQDLNKSLVRQMGTVEGDDDTDSKNALAELEAKVKGLLEEVDELREEAQSVELMLKFTETISDDVYLVAQMMLAQRAFRSLDAEVSEFYESELSREKGKNEAMSSELESFRKEFQTITEQLTTIQAGVDANAEQIKALEPEDGSSKDEEEKKTGP